MKLVGDPEAEAWLEALSAEAFEWDSGNRSKTAKHRVEPSEIESLLQRAVFLAGPYRRPRPRRTAMAAARRNQCGTSVGADLHAPRQQAPAHQLPPHAAKRKEGL